MTSRMVAMGVCLVVSACTATGTHFKGQQAMAPVKVVDSAFTLKQMDGFVQKSERLDITGRRAEAKRMQGKPDPAPGDRLKIAYLLSLENATLDELGQAQAQLDGLETAFADPETRLYVRLLQRMVAAETAQRQDKKRADELQEKLKQIKELELELMKRSQAKPAEVK